MALLLSAGCQTQPATIRRLHAANLHGEALTTLAKQILCDTGEEIVHHPLRAGRTVLARSRRVGSVPSVEVCSANASPCACTVRRRAVRLPGPLDPALLETDLQPAAVQLYREGGDALAVLEQMIDSATCRIDVLMYIWEDDAVGWGSGPASGRSAAPERRVRVLVDGGANLIFTPTPAARPFVGTKPPRQADDHGRRGQPRRLLAGSAAVCRIGPHPQSLRSLRPSQTGADRWPKRLGGRTRTSTIRLVLRAARCHRTRCKGRSSAQMQQLFESYWRDQGGKPACIEPRRHRSWPTRRAVSSQIRRRTHVCATLSITPSIAPVPVWMENPYLCDNGVIVKLARAAARASTSRVVLTIQSDTDSINHANRVTANRLLAAGVRVYLYPGRIHTKCAFVDGCWAYLGSGNFDLLSLRRNHEIGVVFGPGPVVAELEETLFHRRLQSRIGNFASPLPLTCQDYAYEMLADFFL